jgi:hypothetical protein
MVARRESAEPLSRPDICSLDESRLAEDASRVVRRTAIYEATTKVVTVATNIRPAMSGSRNSSDLSVRKGLGSLSDTTNINE